MRVCLLCHPNLVRAMPPNFALDWTSVSDVIVGSIATPDASEAVRIGLPMRGYARQ